jgi:hypothetical protein
MGLALLASPTVAASTLPQIVNELRQVTELKNYTLQSFEASRRRIETARARGVDTLWLSNEIFHTPKLAAPSRIATSAQHRAQYRAEEAIVRLYLADYLNHQTIENRSAILPLFRWYRHPEIIEAGRAWFFQRMESAPQLFEYLDNELIAETFRSYGTWMYDRWAHPGDLVAEIAAHGIDLSQGGSFLHALGESIELGLEAGKAHHWGSRARLFERWVEGLLGEAPLPNPWYLTTVMDQIVALAQEGRPIVPDLVRGLKKMRGLSVAGKQPEWLGDVKRFAAKIIDELIHGCGPQISSAAED